MIEDPYKESFDEFDQRFPVSFRRDGKNYIELSSFATTPESLKSFILTHFIPKTFVREEFRKASAKYRGGSDEVFAIGNALGDLSQALLESDVSGKEKGV